MLSRLSIAYGQTSVSLSCVTLLRRNVVVVRQVGETASVEPAVSEARDPNLAVLAASPAPSRSSRREGIVANRILTVTGNTS